ncbi:hypothetical protein TL5118_04051 [Thalassovita autumnalis]|uniref:HTH cro/C1-type domain-containing protein n=1 Tax=Thalassovita autumnalis TaxID=2072972 RepID=A0A0N7LY21_9RHOB|nr:helix-turn-helix transcriptional regulator [Thalassovita autumnalis]CUH70076.1 hypothetical protein TL5118_04051 [Thalassovita autumnalis]CUH73500.1 hypothetical protein TL5120_03310 [Thalassovita autumnalis]
MTFSFKRRSLSKPANGEKIRLSDLSFVRARNRNKAHSLLLDEFEKSGMSKADLAKMLGKRPEQITRWLGGPANLTLDTLSDLTFAIRGEFFELHLRDDLAKGKSNQPCAEWITNPIRTCRWETVSTETSVAEVKPTQSHTNQYVICSSHPGEEKDGNYARYTTS